MPSVLSNLHSLIKGKILTITFILIFILLPIFLYSQGRLLFCDCGFVSFWTGEIWSSQNSQQFTDPYSFTHVQHGLIFFVLLTIFFKKLAFKIKFLAAVIIEVFWEIIENSNYVIDIYRQNTASLGYSGDTIINSIGDVIACIIGIIIARTVGIKYALAIFVTIEILLALVIKDSLLLNILMIFYPSQTILNWQLGN